MGAVLTNKQVSTSSIELLGATVQYSWENKIVATPQETGFTPAEAQTQGLNNNQNINVTGYIDMDNITSGTVTIPLLKEFAGVLYDGTSTTRTNLIIPIGSSGYLTAYDGTSTTIPVVIKKLTFNTGTSESERAHFVSYTINMIETV